MFDILIAGTVVIVVAGITAVVSTRFPRAMRQWVWLALAEYLVCVVAQVVFTRSVGGGDMLFYAETGKVLARFLDQHFAWAAPELWSLLLQRPSAFDEVVEGGSSNTGSMNALAGWLLFFLGGSDYAAYVVVASFAFFGALGIYKAFQEAYPECPPNRLFASTVLFPSVAFWTSALHKEALCIAGLGALLTAWRGIYSKRLLRVVVCAPIGFGLIVLFRAPALMPVILGLVTYFVVERVERVRGAERAILGPAYFGLALVALAVAMLALTRVAPAFGVDRLGETVTTQQQNWTLSRGGSSFEMGAGDVPQSLAGQLARVPLALLNALFRPQLFDVNNVAALLSALEMTAITVLVIRAGVRQGVRRLVDQIKSSPFLLMCTVVTFVGCAFVGLVTFNFGSLARYRVPFLPFYGALVVALNSQKVRAGQKAPAKPVRAGRRAPSPHTGALARATSGSSRRGHSTLK